MSVSALDTQIVGQSLTLECIVTTVRGITSRVDIVWSSSGRKVEIIQSVNMTLLRENLVVYSAAHTIPLLSTTDDGRVYQCEIVMNTSPPVIAMSNITLNAIGLF